MSRQLAAIWGLALVWAPWSLRAGELIVVYEQPGTQPLSAFLTRQPSRERQPLEPPSTHLGVGHVENLLPIRSPGLTPGRVAARRHTVPFVQPVFLVGSDPASRQWLKRHRRHLKTIGAVGMLVEAGTVKDLEIIATLADGLPIVPASASDIAKALALSHYPVCVTATRIWQ